jgi:hypothetical protein
MTITSVDPSPPISRPTVDPSSTELPHRTAVEIVAKVHHLLTSREGLGRISDLQRSVRTLLVNANKISIARRLVRSRSTAVFHINASSANGGQLVISVRVGGVECGKLLLGSNAAAGTKQRIFTATNPNRFSSCGEIPKPGVDWADKSVREYLVRAAAIVRDATAKKTLANREAVIEADLLKAMTKRRPGDRQNALMNHQPVLYPLRGLPFQFPMPIGARNIPTLGEGAGHVDVLARAGRGGRCLRIFEVKGPEANDVDHALNQAVAYCAALRFLLTDSPRAESESLYRVLGFRRHPAHHPRVEAVAVVKDTPENRHQVSAAAKMLETGSSSPFRLLALFYTSSDGTTIFGPIVSASAQ